MESGFSQDFVEKIVTYAHEQQKHDAELLNAMQVTRDYEKILEFKSLQFDYTFWPIWRGIFMIQNICYYIALLFVIFIGLHVFLPFIICFIPIPINNEIMLEILKENRKIVLNAIDVTFQFIFSSV